MVPMGNPWRLKSGRKVNAPKFFMEEDMTKCVTELDRWMYILKNMAHLSEIPWKDENEIFAEIAQVMRVDALTPEEREAYEKSCAALRDGENMEPGSRHADTD